jgi:hypothetical protein
MGVPGVTATPEQLRILRHMLGINTPERAEPKPYRNHYAANPGDAELAELERLGMVVRFEPRIPAEYDFFQCTAAGREAALRSFKSIRLPKKRRVYLKFLDVSDCHPDLTFREFLTSPDYDECRRSA